MVDIILTLALIALTVVSLLYIGGCDHLQTDDSPLGAAQTQPQPRPGKQSHPSKRR